MTKNGRMASHIPVLVGAFDLSEGDVLEVGTGYFSTTLLHWLGATTGRKIVSYETDPKWYAHAKRYQCDYHDIIFVKNWNDIPVDKKYWGLAFIDHAPAQQRAKEIEQTHGINPWFVLESRSEKSDPSWMWVKE
ncbi:TPA: hypothetical protein DCZ81_01645 [Candidatus Collierbacteria bacterium]|nr:hypothetical protein [Candidatus Collierbacteria bacterium]